MPAEDNKYLIFNLGKEIYGIPILKVRTIERKMEITPVPGTPGFVKGITNLRGKIIPVMDLKDKFGIGKIEMTDRICIIIVDIRTDSGAQMHGIIVDGVTEVLDISDGYIEPLPEGADLRVNRDFMKGLGKIKDMIIILLDIEKILELPEPADETKGVNK